jgi:L-alanine-DL-glutamate epimerase-like enolase superfamily enzyme
VLARGADVGVGLRMALYDALGRALEVPLHRVFGRRQVREWTPASWWSTKMPPELLAREAAEAQAAGYVSHKVKARPWFDLFAQLDAIVAATDPGYGVELDWNSMLVNASQALPVLREVERHGVVELFESPIGRTDIDGHRRLRDALTLPLFEHFDTAFATRWLRDDAMDGFVMDPSDPVRLFAEVDLLDAFRKDCFLQMCGTGLTAAWVSHMGAVCAPARRPAVTVSHIYENDILVDPLTVRSGHVRVPDGPGLGVAVDHELLERLRVPSGYRTPRTRTLLTFDAPGHGSRQFVSAEQLWAESTANASFPVQPRGASLAIAEDDGTHEFDRMYESAAAAPRLL